MLPVKTNYYFLGFCILQAQSHFILLYLINTQVKGLQLRPFWLTQYFHSFSSNLTVFYIENIKHSWSFFKLFQFALINWEHPSCFKVLWSQSNKFYSDWGSEDWVSLLRRILPNWKIISFYWQWSSVCSD